jgi:O-antigen ligase
MHGTTAVLHARIRDTPRLRRLADWFAIGVAVSLPWSTSAAAILIALWLAAVSPTMSIEQIRRELATAAGGLPALLWVLAAVGMLWADVSWSERLAGLGHFNRLLMIPLLLAQFRRSGRGLWVLYGYLASTLGVLIASWALALVPGLAWHGSQFGVPTKDYIFQGESFALCAFALIGRAGERGRAGQWPAVLGLVAIAALFLANIFFVATGRTVLVVIPVLALFVGWRQFGWKGLLGAGLVGVAVGTAVWFTSPYLRARVNDSFADLAAYRQSDEPNSTGLHLDLLRKSLPITATAPIIGHGTGSVFEQFRRVTTVGTGASSMLAANPHNQVLAVAIQLGLVGSSVLLAMWIAHVLLFRGGGLVALIGAIVVIENVIASLFNSHLFDFTEGWLYVFGVGVAGGTVLRQRDPAPDAALADVSKAIES